MDSHDTERLASMIVNPDIWYDHNAIPRPNNNWNVRKPNKLERAKQKLMVAIQMTLPGAPMIYYGDEAGMWGGDDPDDRKPMVWPEFKYENETHHPFGKKRPNDSVKFDSSLFNWSRKMILLRKENRALSLGNIKFKIIDNNEKILAYKRDFDDETLWVIANNNPDTNKIALKVLGIKAKQLDLINNNKYTAESKVSLKPYGIAVFKAVK
jgi:cyclomaltodextrinase